MQSPIKIRILFFIEKEYSLKICTEAQKAPDSQSNSEPKTNNAEGNTTSDFKSHCNNNSKNHGKAQSRHIGHRSRLKVPGIKSCDCSYLILPRG